MSIILGLLCAEIPAALQVRVSAKAAANRLKVEYKTDGSMLVRAYVTVAAEDGKANKAVLRLLADDLDLPISAFRIIKGELCRDKVVKIEAP